MTFIWLLISTFFIFIESKTLIVTNNKNCTLMTKDVLTNGGSIIDAGIRAVLCEGIVNPQDTGIGGGFTGVFKLGKKTLMINAREVSPINLKSVNLIDTKKYGSIGVPGMIKGFALLHKKYGKLSWEEIFKPVIHLCEVGVKWEDNRFLLHLIFMNRMYKLLDKENKIIINRPLCSTLKTISLYGPNYFYNNISHYLVNELNENSFLTVKDFKNYKAKLLLPSVEYVNDIKMISTSYPGSGKELLTAIRSLLESDESLINIINEFYRQNYQKRYYVYTKYSNENNEKTDDIKIHGTSNICIQQDNNGLCFTSTINHYFGSTFYSEETGIILNDQLHDIPSYYTNIYNPIVPPTSSSTTLFFRKGKLFLLLGGTGGDRIPAGVLNVVNLILKFKMSLVKALRIQRIYYYDNMLEIEKCRVEWECLNRLSRRVVSSLLRKADMESLDYINAASYSYNTVTGIYKNEAEYDPRRGGYGIIF
jgi:gamma-glutamyltranspeptidase